MVDEKQVQAGASVYSRGVLSLYDWWVLRVSNSFAWRCDRSVMLAQYDRCIGRRHLEIGPGTAWYLVNSRATGDCADLTLFDLNNDVLEHCSHRLDRAVTTVTGSILDELPDGLRDFDSIGMNFVFHCVPGAGWPEKGQVFTQLAGRLNSGGVLFGSTILGRGTRPNAFARTLLRTYNRSGIFHNYEDDLPGLEAELNRVFADVSVRAVGDVAVFECRSPKDVPAR